MLQTCKYSGLCKHYYAMTDTISGDRAPRSAASIAIVARVAMSVTLTLPVYLLLLLLLLNRMNVADVSSVHRRSRIARHRLILLFFPGKMLPQ